jgi:hypothetical protein
MADTRDAPHAKTAPMAWVRKLTAWRQRPQPTPAPGMIVLADELWREVAPGALHVLTGEVASGHPLIWVEGPLSRTWRAPGRGGRIRRSLRLDLPATRYVDGRRELDVATPPIVPAGNPVGDALLAQTVTWLLRARRTSPRVLWLARRGPAGSALAKRLRPDVTIDWHDDPQPNDRWCPEADLVLWPAWAPLPEGESEADPRLMRLTDMGVRGLLAFLPTVEGWLAPTLRVGPATAVGHVTRP